MLSLLAGVYRLKGPEMMMDGNPNGTFPAVVMVVWFITWIAIVSVLFSLARLLWKKGNKVK